MTNIDSAFYNYDETVEKSKTSYSGLLGLAISGNRIVNHPTRAGYVYVRLRDNLSEVVQAFNDKVSPVYDFPVLIQRKGNRWYVLGRDDLRYESWGTSAPYLPRHGDQHSFNRDGGGGGDVTWVYPDQFMPLLVYPSGTYGASNLLIAPYVLQKSDKFIYVGNTGTANIARYKPTTSNAIMGLVYLDRETGNPGFLINSGTPFSGNITGTNAVVPYLPYPSATQEPLYAFRLVSGTTSLTWSNLYNVRQFIGGSTSTGTSTSNHEELSGLLGGSINNHYHLTTSQIIGLVSGTSTTLHQHSGTSPAGSTNAVQVNNGGVFGGDDEFTYTVGGQIVSLGKNSGTEATHVFSWSAGGLGVSFHNIASWGTGNYSSMRGILARGTKASPTAAQADDIAMRFRGSAYDGVGLVLSSATGAEIRFVANENQSATNHGMRAEIWTTPDGSTTEAITAIIKSGSLSIVNATDPKLILNEGNTGTSLFEIVDTSSAIGTIKKTALTGTALIDIDPLPSDGTGNAGFRFFRSTNTTGQVYLQVYKGDNTATISGQISGNSVNPTYFGTQNNVGIGVASPAGRLHVVGLADDEQFIVDFYSTQSTVTNPIRFRTSAGSDVFTFSALGGMVGNEPGNAAGDFRWESDTEANFIFLDADGNTDGTLYLGGSTNGIKILKGGELSLIGTATVWDDLRVSPDVKGTGAKDPSWTAWLSGVYLYDFDNAAAGSEKELWFNVQLPHGWKEGTSVYPHVHWVNKTAGTAGHVVRWGLEYTVAKIGGTFPAVTTVYGTTIVGGGDITVANEHMITSFDPITMTGNTISTILSCRLFRNSSNAADTYTGTAGILSIDWHFEIDKIGSSTEFA